MPLASLFFKQVEKRLEARGSLAHPKAPTKKRLTKLLGRGQFPPRLRLDFLGNQSPIFCGNLLGTVNYQRKQLIRLSFQPQIINDCW